jgi:hypothetical protein
VARRLIVPPGHATPADIAIVAEKRLFTRSARKTQHEESQSTSTKTAPDRKRSSPRASKGSTCTLPKAGVHGDPPTPPLPAQWGCKPKPPKIAPTSNFPHFDGWRRCQVGLKGASDLGSTSPTLRISTEIRKVQGIMARFLWRYAVHPCLETPAGIFGGLGVHPRSGILPHKIFRYPPSPIRSLLGVALRLGPLVREAVSDSGLGRGSPAKQSFPVRYRPPRPKGRCGAESC